METKNFENGQIGFEVKDIKDILAAKSLGFCLCNANGYYFDDDVTEQDEDGIDVDREPTEEEKTNRAIEELKDGCAVYAVVCWLPNHYKLVRDTATILQSEFYVTQDVYIIHDNKIVRAKVMKVQMAQSWSGANGQGIKTETKYEVEYGEFGRVYNVVVGNDNIFESVEKLTEHLTSNIR